MATNSTVTFTHNIFTTTNPRIGQLQYEKYDTKGIAFDLTSLHSRATTYTLVADLFLYNYNYASRTVDIDLGLAPYTTGQSTPFGITSTTTIRATVTLSSGYEGRKSVTFTYTNASNQSNCWDRPFYICNYGFATSVYNVGIDDPRIEQVVRQYSIPIPAAGDKITHSDLATFATWCKMTGSATHTTANTSIAAADSNRPWGTSVTMVNNSGSLVTTSSTYTKTAGTAVEATWISSALSACNNRSWTR